MRSSSRTTLPPDEKRCQHYDSKGSRCPNWALNGHPVCPNHAPDTPQKTASPQSTPPPFHLDEMLSELFRTQQRLAIAIEESLPEMDLKTLAELSETVTGNALRITRTLRQTQEIQGNKTENILDEALDTIARRLGLDL